MNTICNMNTYNMNIICKRTQYAQYAQYALSSEVVVHWLTCSVRRRYKDTISLIQVLHVPCTVVHGTRWYMLLIMIPAQYPNYYKEIYTGPFDSLDVMILFSLSQQYRNNERLVNNNYKTYLFISKFKILFVFLFLIPPPC